MSTPSLPAWRDAVNFAAINSYLKEAGFGGLVSVEYNAMTDPTETIRNVLTELGALSR